MTFDIVIFNYFAHCTFVVFTVMDSTQLADKPGPLFDWFKVRSIILMAKMVVACLNMSMRFIYNVRHKIPVPIESFAFPNDDIKERMKRVGWCPSEIRTMNKKCQSLQTLVVLSTMDRSFLGKAHDACTEEVCSSHQIELMDYEPKHREAGCSCENNEDVDEDVCKVLNNSIALLCQC